jgi:peptidyl-prolyl cis-trans isomerase B (cyclophilin B)
VEADPGDFFARVNLVHLLRRANLLDDAETAAAALEKQFPLGMSGPAVAGVRRPLLFARGRFAEGLRLSADRDEPTARELLDAWDDEAAARMLEAPDLPRVAFQTTKGRVVVALYAKDAPQTVARLLELVAAGHYTDASFDEVTGGVGARAAAAKPVEKRLPREKNERRAWRGTLAFVWEDGSTGGNLGFLTGHGGDSAIGRVVEGMEFVDALEAGDRIESAKVSRP